MFMAHTLLIMEIYSSQLPALAPNFNSNLRAVSSSSFKAMTLKHVIFVKCFKLMESKKESQKSCSGRKNTNTAFLWPSFINTVNSILTYINAIIYT